MNMQFKKVTFLILATGISALSMAQGFHIGAKAGANLFKVDGKSFSEEFNLGYTLGAFSEINFNKKWGLQPEVLESN